MATGVAPMGLGVEGAAPEPAGGAGVTPMDVTMESVTAAPADVSSTIPSEVVPMDDGDDDDDDDDDDTSDSSTSDDSVPEPPFADPGGAVVDDVAFQRELELALEDDDDPVPTPVSGQPDGLGGEEEVKKPKFSGKHCATLTPWQAMSLNKKMKGGFAYVNKDTLQTPKRFSAKHCTMLTYTQAMNINKKLRGGFTFVNRDGVAPLAPLPLNPKRQRKPVEDELGVGRRVRESTLSHTLDQGVQHLTESGARAKKSKGPKKGRKSAAPSRMLPGTNLAVPAPAPYRPPAPYQRGRGRKSKAGRTAQLKHCGTVLNKVMGHEFAWPFNEAVDPVKLNIPDYFSVVKAPMDFSTIKHNLDYGAYQHEDEFVADVEQVFTNCRLYNRQGDHIVQMCDAVEAFFEDTFHPQRQATQLQPQEIAYVTPQVKKTTKRAGRQKQQPRYDEYAPPPVQYQAPAAAPPVQYAPAPVVIDTSQIEQKFDMKIEEKLTQMTQIMENIKYFADELEKIKKTAADVGVPVEAPQGAAKTKRKSKSSRRSVSKRKSRSRKRSVVSSSRKRKRYESSEGSESTTSTSEASHHRGAQPPALKPMEYTEKKRLSMNIGKLPADRLVKVVEIIRETMPSLNQNDPDVVEIDIDSLDTKTLRSLEKYVEETLSECKKRKNAKKKKKDKSLARQASSQQPPAKRVKKSHTSTTAAAAALPSSSHTALPSSSSHTAPAPADAAAAPAAAASTVGTSTTSSAFPPTAPITPASATSLPSVLPSTSLPSTSLPSTSLPSTSLPSTSLPAPAHTSGPPTGATPSSAAAAARHGPPTTAKAVEGGGEDGGESGEVSAAIAAAARPEVEDTVMTPAVTEANAIVNKDADMQDVEAAAPRPADADVKKKPAMENLNSWAALANDDDDGAAAASARVPAASTPGGEAASSKLWSEFQARESLQKQRDAERAREDEKIKRAREQEEKDREAAVARRVKEAALEAEAEAQEARRKLQEARAAELAALEQEEGALDLNEQSNAMATFEGGEFGNMADFMNNADIQNLR